jgi:hypothetical protein
MKKEKPFSISPQHSQCTGTEINSSYFSYFRFSICRVDILRGQRELK